MLRFDPQFIRSARKERGIKGSPQKQLSTEVDGVLNSQEFWGHAILQFPSYLWVQYIRCHIMLRGPLQPDLWPVEKAESCLMCLCAWARVRWWLGLDTEKIGLSRSLSLDWSRTYPSLHLSSRSVPTGLDPINRYQLPASIPTSSHVMGSTNPCMFRQRTCFSFI